MEKMPSPAEVSAWLSAKEFSHTRAGSGCWRGLVWIYHFDSRSPSGVRLIGGVAESQFDAIKGKPAGSAPLSPTEPR